MTLFHLRDRDAHRRHARAPNRLGRLFVAGHLFGGVDDLAMPREFRVAGQLGANRCFVADQDEIDVVVASPRGGHVVRVLARRTTTLQQATPQLRRSVLQQQQSSAVQALLTRTAASLHVSINPRFGSWDGKNLSVVAASTTGSHEVSSPAAPAGGPAPSGDQLLPSQG